MATLPADRVATRPWVTACQIAGAALIRGERSQPIAFAPCFYPMATAVKPARPRTLAALASHPWVEAINDDRDTGDNLHVYLRPGFVWAGTTSAVIEPTVREACQAFREVAWDPAAWGEACGASPAEVAALTGEAAPAPAAPAPRPVLPGEATPPPAPSHGEAAPSLPELRADAAAGRPVSLSALARAAQSEMAARRAARRAARTGG
jgi:hypothetical protein